MGQGRRSTQCCGHSRSARESERGARERQEDVVEEDDSEDDIDEENGPLADLSPEQIEKASPATLLAMLSPKQRQKFENAIKDPQSASQLMQRLDRKAQQRTQQNTLRKDDGVLITTQTQQSSASDQRPRKKQNGRRCRGSRIPILVQILMLRVPSKEWTLSWRVSRQSSRPRARVEAWVGSQRPSLWSTICAQCSWLMRIHLDGWMSKVCRRKPGKCCLYSKLRAV